LVYWWLSGWGIGFAISQQPVQFGFGQRVVTLGEGSHSRASPLQTLWCIHRRTKGFDMEMSIVLTRWMGSACFILFMKSCLLFLQMINRWTDNGQQVYWDTWGGDYRLNAYILTYIKCRRYITEQSNFFMPSVLIKSVSRKRTETAAFGSNFLCSRDVQLCIVCIHSVSTIMWYGYKYSS